MRRERERQRRIDEVRRASGRRSAPLSDDVLDFEVVIFGTALLLLLLLSFAIDYSVVVLWPFFLTCTFLNVHLFEGRRWVLGRLNGSDEVRDFMNSCTYGSARSDVDRDLWLSVLDEVDDGSTYRRRLRFVLGVLLAATGLTVSLCVAAARTDAVSWQVVGYALASTLSLVGWIVLAHVLQRRKTAKVVQLRRHLERHAS